jgi:hypothetical protein
MSVQGSDLPTAGPALYWGVKKSFRDYVRGAMGEITVVAPAFLRGDQVVFPADLPAPGAPADGVLRFRGAVRFQAHYGMLDVTVREPWIDTATGTLTVEHGGVDTPPRIPLASLPGALSGGDAEEDDGMLVQRDLPARLAKEGAAVFKFTYPEGTELDPVTYVAP